MNSLPLSLYLKSRVIGSPLEGAAARALTGHGGGNGVARGYGSDDMVRRFGFPRLKEALEKAHYPGLDLTVLRWAAPA
jgi:hypothetical protein